MVGRARRREEGAAALEFALVAPLLLLLAVGIMSYGYMLSFRQALGQAAAEGARAAAVELDDALREPDALAAVNEGLGGFSISCDGTRLTNAAGTVVGSCDVSLAKCSTGQPTDDPQCVRVTLSYDYAAHPLTPAMPGVGVVLPERLAYASSARVS